MCAMLARTLPTQQFLREALDYDPTTGALRWRERPRSHFASDHGFKIFNVSRPGRLVGISRHRDGHSKICLNDTTYLAHRAIWKLMTGDEPPEIDHRDGDPSNNRWHNLRAATKEGNRRNSRGKRARLHDLPKGVRPVRGSRRVAAVLGIAGQEHWLGTFATAEEAHAAYCAAAQEHFGEFWNPG